jgi:hypothetical protein
MSMEYVESRIKEALKLCGGNRLKARQQVIAWTYEDNKLLHALASPHLSGIVAYNVERVDSGRAEAAKAPPPPPEEPPVQAEKQDSAPRPNSKPQAKAKPQKPKDEQFGLEILKAATGGNSTMFGLEDTGAPQKRQGASQSHIDTMKAIASKGKKPE